MPSLKGRSPNNAYSELLKVSNSGAGIDGTLRNIEDGAGNPTGIQIGTGMVGIFGYQFPSTGFTAGQVLRINAANNAFEWHAPAASDLTGLAAIATSGSYTDLKNTPTIPTSVSQLTNDSGFVTSSQVTTTYGSGPFVLPTASASVLGGVKIGTGISIALGVLSANVTSVAGRTGVVALAVADVSGAAPLASPALTGSPTAPTAATGDASTKLANTQFVFNATQVPVSVALTGSAMTLTAAQYSNVSIIFTGALTQNITVTVPSAFGMWTIYNATTGSFTVTLTNGAGATFVIDQNQSVELFSAGSVGVIPAGTLSTTPTAGDNTKRIATTAFVTSAITTATPTRTSQLTNDSNFITASGAPVQSVAGRTGAVVLSTTDISGISSYAALASPAFSGTPTVPTATAGTANTQIASTAFVSSAISTATPTKTSQLTNDSSFITASGAPVQSVAGRTGAVVLAVADISGAAPTASPTFTGTPAAPTATAGTNTTQLATTAFVTSAITTATPTKTSQLTNDSGYITSVGAPVQSVAGRTGAVVLSTTDISGIGSYATLASPTFTGTPVVPTATAGTNTTQAASTAFVTSAISAYSAPVTSVAGRTGAVVLSTTDISGITNYAPLASPALTGSPTVPTASAGTSTTQVASTAFVANAVSGVMSVPLVASNVTLSAAQYGAPIIIFTGTPTANITVTFPAAGLWTVINATTGAFTVTMTATTGGSIVIPSTYTAELVAISTGLNYANSIVPATSITSPNQAPVSMGWLAQVLAGMNTIPVTGNTTLVASQTAYSILLFTGSLSTAATITLPLVPSGVGSTDTAILWNQSGAALTFTVNTGGTITLANGESCSASLSNAYGIYLVDQISYTQSAGDNSHKIATTAFVQSALSTYTAPVTSVAGRTGAITLAVADVTGAAPLASPTFTGTASAPTPAQFDNSTKIATTAFVQSSGMQFNGFTLYNTATTLTAAQIGMAVQNYSASANTFTLPTAASIATGRTFYIFNQGGSTLTINLAGGSDFFWSGIASLTSLVLNRGESVMIMSRGVGSTEYDIIGGSYANKFAVRQLVNTTTDDGVSALQVSGYATATTPAVYDDTTKLATTQWCNDVPFRRNKIINSRFDIWQRGTSWTTPVTGTYTADKWRVDYTGTSAGVFTVGQALNNTQPNGITSTIGPNGLLSWNHTTAPNLTSLMLSHRCEDAQTYSGNTCTVSFNIALGAGSQTAFTLGVNLAQCYGTGGSPSATVTTATQSITINSATFQRVSFTFTLPTASGTFGTNGNDYVAVQFILPTNQLFSFYLDHVQFEPGSVATPFMNVLIPQELAMCQRYYNKTFPTTINPAINSLNYVSPLTGVIPTVGGVVQNIFWQFPEPMRTTPTTAFYCVGNSTSAFWTTTGGAIGTTAATVTRSANTGVAVSLPVGSTNNIYVIHMTADADL